MNWQTELMERHPRLFRSDPSGQAPGYPTVGDGWRRVVETAIARIEEAVGGPVKDRGAVIRIVQIKEKFGGLRIYFDATTLPSEAAAKVQDAIDLAEARSYCTCEVCGEVGRLHDEGGWYATRCDWHANGEPIEPRHGAPDLHIQYTVVGGKMRVIRCRRYDRERDAFADAPLPFGETWAEEK